MSGVNKVILVGRLGQDPDIRYGASGNAVANVSLATSEVWKDKDTGDKQEKTEWHRVVFFKRLAEVIAQYVTKGDMIYVEGALQTRKWQDKEGNDRWTTEIVARNMQMLQTKGNSSQDRPPEPPAAASPTDIAGKMGAGNESTPNVDDWFPQDKGAQVAPHADDDIPF